MEIYQKTIVDSEQRVVLPSVFYKNPQFPFVEPVILTRNPQANTILVWSAGRWKQLLHSIEAQKEKQKNDRIILAFERCVVNSAKHISVDNKYGVQLPQHYLHYANIEVGHEVLIEGNEKTLSISKISREICHG